MIDRDWTVAPGDTLRDWLEERDMNPARGAALCRLDRATFERILAGEEPITHEIALGLHAATGISTVFWERYEANYRADLAAGRQRFE